MIRNFLPFVFFLISFQAFSQNDVGVIWMGFEHEWTYNHRLNRLGDYIEQPEFEGYDHPVKHYHTGATGLGWDDALFSSYYNIIKSDKIGFQSGFVDIKLENKEGQRAYVKKKVSLPLQSNLKNKDQIVGLLNGFDLVAIDGADKLKTLSIDISDPIYNYDKSRVDFIVEVGFIANCGSFECHRFNQTYNYTIKVQYLLIAGNRADFFGTEKSFIKTYEWDKHDTFEDGMVNETVRGYTGFPIATIGFKSIMVNMDRDHWLVNWHTAIHPQFYDETTGNFEFAIDLLLQQWKKSTSPMKIVSRFSKRKDGWAYLDGSVVLLQFKDACLETKSRFGSLNWKGRNKEADNNDAINVERFRVKAGCDN
ncbi:MAG: hypothetical protein KDD32_06505 [Bacteroidetes bacterium]|nr:hypothetical protein [Bacteroidota bacterium]